MGGCDQPRPKRRRAPTSLPPNTSLHVGRGGGVNWRPHPHCVARHRNCQSQPSTAPPAPPTQQCPHAEGSGASACLHTWKAHKRTRTQHAGTRECMSGGASWRTPDLLNGSAPTEYALGPFPGGTRGTMGCPPWGSWGPGDRGYWARLGHCTPSGTLSPSPCGTLSPWGIRNAVCSWAGGGWGGGGGGVSLGVNVHTA